MAISILVATFSSVFVIIIINGIMICYRVAFRCFQVGTLRQWRCRLDPCKVFYQFVF